EHADRIRVGTSSHAHIASTLRHSPHAALEKDERRLERYPPTRDVGFVHLVLECIVGGRAGARRVLHELLRDVLDPLFYSCDAHGVSLLRSHASVLRGVTRHFGNSASRPGAAESPSSRQPEGCCVPIRPRGTGVLLPAVPVA